MHDPNSHRHASADTGTTTSSRQGEGFWTQFEHLARTLGDVITRLVRQGNRRRVTLRSREGEVWVRMPLTLAALLALLLLPYWPLLVVLIVVGFAVGAQVAVERQPDAPSSDAPGRGDGTAGAAPRPDDSAG